jgi:hypothetical protein
VLILDTFQNGSSYRAVIRAGDVVMVLDVQPLESGHDRAGDGRRDDRRRPQARRTDRLAELASADVVALPDQQVRDELLGLLGCLNSVSALVASRLDVFDTRELAELDGFRTATAWLRGFGRLSPGAASGLHKRARVLRALPALQAAALDGAVSAEHVDKVQQLTDRVDLEQIKAYDDILADLCAAAAPAEAQKACERIAAHHDPDGADPDPAADFERRDLSVSRSGSMTYVKARLDAEGGAAFQAVLDAVMRPPAKDDPRSAGQRRADAMIDLCRATLAGGTLSTVQGVRPQIGLLITPEQLAGPRPTPRPTPRPAPRPAPRRAAFGKAVAAATDPLARVAGPLARAADPLTAAGVPDVDQPWLSWVGQIPNATARRLACDAEFFRIVLDPRNGLPLDVGGAYRIVIFRLGSVVCGHFHRPGSRPTRSSPRSPPCARPTCRPTAAAVRVRLRHRPGRAGGPGRRGPRRQRRRQRAGPDRVPVPAGDGERARRGGASLLGGGPPECPRWSATSPAAVPSRSSSR